MFTRDDDNVGRRVNFFPPAFVIRSDFLLPH